MMQATDQETRMQSVLDEWRREGVRWVRFEVGDLHGTSRSKLVPIDRVAAVSRSGLTMYGGAAVLDTRSDIVLGSRYNEETGYADQLLVPDWETARIVPWLERTGRVLCTSRWHDGRPLAAVPRYVLRRVLERYAKLGLQPVSATEHEFYVLDAVTREPLFGGYHIFNSARNLSSPFIDRLRELLLAIGIDVITVNCEYAPSQWEITYAAKPGMEGPDDAFTFKNAVKEVALQEGVIATFMSKPLRGSSGSGAHFHVSLADAGGRNVMGEDAAELEPTALRHFVGGQIRHASEVYALLAPTVNCLKRRRPHTFSPTNVSWGHEDRSALVRIKGGAPESRHVEHRAPTGLSNPYLVAAAVLAAGLQGIEKELDPGPPSEMHGIPAEENGDYPPLPTSLPEALDALDGSRSMRELLGDEFVDVYLTVRRHELGRFADHVTDWERDEYLELY